LKYDYFFTAITDILKVNPKHTKQFELCFEESPKFMFSTNFGLRESDPSLLARLLFCVFSDFFHEKSDMTDYRETRKPNDIVGKELFKDFTAEEWNYYYNFLAQCVQIYLRYDKINPPMSEVTTRNIKEEIGDDFLNWADVYFSDISGRTDKLYPKHIAYDEFKFDSGNKAITMKTFTSKLKRWAQLRRYNYNPARVMNGNDRLLRKWLNKPSAEMCYIQTKEDITDTIWYPASEMPTSNFAEAVSGDKDVDF
jgi:hypothetical protein